MENWLKKMVDNIDEGLIVIDNNLNFIFANRAVETIGINFEAIIGKNIFEVFPNLKKTNSTFIKVLETSEPLLKQEQVFITYRGEKRTTLTSTYPIVEGGKVVGAFETFQDISKLQTLVDQLQSLQLEQKKQNDLNKPNKHKPEIFQDFIGEDVKIQEIKKQIDVLAKSPSPIFIYGETGTGKEILIQSLHKAGKSGDPLITQNCAAIPENLMESYLFGTTKGSFTGAQDKEGLFEIADGGTLFLDEINSLPLNLQAKLLRVVQENKIRRVGSVHEVAVDVRLIAATNVHPDKLLSNQEMRKDLYYRLNVLNIELPPLRNRKNDIPLLTDYFVTYFNKLFNKNIKGATDTVINEFMNYSWPGNIRELKNIIERIMNLKSVGYIEQTDVQFNNVLQVSENTSRNFASGSTLSFQKQIQETEIDIIKNEIYNTRGNISQASRNLDMPQQTLSNKIKRYGLNSYILRLKLLNNE